MGIVILVEWLSPLISHWTAPEWSVAGGVVAAVVCWLMTKPALTTCEVAPGRWPLITTLTGLILGAALAWCIETLNCQQTPVVRPDPIWQDLRMLSHCLCLGLLIVVTATDLASLYIPNFVVHFGLLFAISAATISGQLQLEHLWVDWNEEIPQISGPYIPEWIRQSQHWHGLGWSVVGALVSACLTAFVRKAAEWTLGRPSMGAGDVSLMAMIGAFIGWQASVVAFFIAPLLALLLGPLSRRISREQAVPYGPFLALAAVIVMFAWRWIWMFEVEMSTSEDLGHDDRATAFAVRRLFGDWALLAGLFATAIGGTAFLMGLIRLFWSIPLTASLPASPASRQTQSDVTTLSQASRHQADCPREE